MKCEKCGKEKAFTNTDQNNGLIGVWTCQSCFGQEQQESNKQITLTLKENGQIRIQYPNGFSYMELIGIIESSKAILLDKYVDPEKDNEK